MKAPAKKNIKISRQELETNEVLEAADHAVIFLRLHGKKIATALIVVLAVYSAVIIYRAHQESVLRSASDALYDVTLSYDKALTEHEWGTPERSAAMKKVAASAEEVRKAYASLPIARNALFLEANANYYAGDDVGSVTNTQEAIKLFTEYADLAKQQGDDFEQAGALLALGNAQENLSALTRTTNVEGSNQALVAAASFYDEIIKLPKAGFLRYEAMNAKGRILAEAGKRDEAIAIYKQVVKENYHPVELPKEITSARDMQLYSLRSIANQFTTGSNAKAELTRLGVEQDEDKTE